LEKLIKKLTETYGPSGREDKIREVIKTEVEGLADEIRTDYLGNLIVLKKGSASEDTKPIMLAAHMDEIGLMITHVDKEGFLRFTNVGGVAPSRLVGTRVVLPSGQKGHVFHEPLKDLKELDLEKMYIDIGAKDQEEAKKHVTIGDIAVYDQNLVNLGNRLMAKAMDDRIGCAVLIMALQEMKNNPNDVYFVFTSQEEVGLRGARTSAYGLNPGLGIAVDVTMTGDTPEAKKMDVKLGGGAAIKVKDSSMITSPLVKDKMVEIAEKENIKYQLEVLSRGGTDAGAINLTREGILAGCISIPCRYVHSPGEMVDSGDVEAAVKLLVKIIEEKVEF